MNHAISKSQFKSQVLEHLRTVETKKEPLIITHGGKPVVKVVPYTEDPEKILVSLRNSVIFYKDPTEPVGEDTWEALQ